MRILTLIFLLVCTVARAANPSFQSFDSTQFDAQPTPAHVAIKDGVKMTNVNTYALLNANQVFAFGDSNLQVDVTTGTNQIPVFTSSSVDLNSNVGSGALLELFEGGHANQWLVLVSTNGTATIKNGSLTATGTGTVHNLGNADVNLNAGDATVYFWKPEFAAWVQTSSVFGTNGTGGGITINPTNGRLPYRINDTTFGDSPIERVTPTTIYIHNESGGQTLIPFNISGSHNISLTGDWIQFSSNSVAGINLYPTAADGTTTFTLNSLISHTTGKLFDLKNNGTSVATVSAVSGYTGAGTKALTDDGTYKTIGGSGGIGDNWTASGTTNSTLPGVASVNRVIATNSVSSGAAGTAGIITVYDTDASNSASFSANPVTTTDVNLQMPAAPFTGLVKSTIGSGTNMVITAAVAGTDYQAAGNYVTAITSVDNEIARYNGTAGALQTSGLTISDNQVLTVPGLTLTASEPNTISQTWNNSGVSFYGLVFNLTNTASAITSYPIALKLSGTDNFRVRRDGVLQFNIAQAISGNMSLYDGSANLCATFSSGEIYVGGTVDTPLKRYAAGFLQLGDDAATPPAVGIKGPNGFGTDKTGGAVTIYGGASTGTGRGGAFQTATAVSATGTGSTTNSFSTRIYQAPKPVTLTESTATLVANVTVATGKYAGIRVYATTFADDGTDFQATTEEIIISAVNKAGTVSTGISASVGLSTVASSVSTLTTTWTAVANGSSVDIKNSAVSSLAQTTLGVKYTLEINSNDAATVTPQ